MERNNPEQPIKPISNLLDNFYPGFHHPFAEVILLPDRISLPQDWIETLEKVYQETSHDGKERAVLVSLNTKTRDTSIVHNIKWTGNKDNIPENVFKGLLDTFQYDYPNHLLAIGHSHPTPIHNYKSWESYQQPRSLAFFSPDDIKAFLYKNKMPPIFFAFDKHEISIIIRTDYPSRKLPHHELFYLKYFYPYLKKYLPPQTSQTMIKTQNDSLNFRDMLSLMYQGNKVKHSPVKQDFDPFQWNKEVVKELGLHLYHGHYSNLQKVV